MDTFKAGDIITWRRKDAPDPSLLSLLTERYGPGPFVVEGVVDLPVEAARRSAHPQLVKLGEGNRHAQNKIVSAAHFRLDDGAPEELDPVKKAALEALVRSLPLTAAQKRSALEAMAGANATEADQILENFERLKVLMGVKDGAASPRARTRPDGVGATHP